jgi:biotin carboxyl carrier protein
MQQQLDELKRLASGRVDLKTFYEHLLRQISAATSAQAGLVWDCTQSPYRVVAELQNGSAAQLRSSIQHQKHTALLETAIKRNQPILIPPRAEAPDGLPVIALGPVRRDGEVELIELFLRPDGTEDNFKEWLLCLQEFCLVARELPASAAAPALPAFTARAVHPTGPTNLSQGSSHPPTAPHAPPPHVPAAAPAQVLPATPAATRSRPRTPEELEHFLYLLHRGLDPRETLSRIANETRRFLDADRVSVVQWVRGKARIQAISGQPSVNRRSTTVHQLHRLVNAVLPLGQTFWYPQADEGHLPNEIEHPLNEYLTTSTVRSLIVVPVSDQSEVSTDDPDAAKKPVKWIAGLVVEKFDALWNRQEMAPTIELVARHAGSALRNSIQHRAMFLFPLWHALGKTKLVLAARNARWTTLVLASLLILGLVLTLVPAPFKIACDGILLPERRHNVFAQTDGDVDSILVDHGSRVEAGQTVVQLKNEELLRQRQEILGEIEPLKKEIAAMDSRMLDRQRSDQDPNNEGAASVDQSSRRALLENAQRRLEIVDSHIKMLDVHAPMTGQVLTWDVKQQLSGKPVRRGDLLMEVADVDGAWELELKLPDKRIGHILRAQAAEGQELPVTFVLAADPNVSWEGKVRSIAHATQVDATDGQTIRVDVEFDHSKLDIKQVRSGVLAKIHCGSRPVGYVWLHDIFEFVQSKVLFRLW